MHACVTSIEASPAAASPALAKHYAGNAWAGIRVNSSGQIKSYFTRSPGARSTRGTVVVVEPKTAQAPSPTGASTYWYLGNGERPSVGVSDRADRSALGWARSGPEGARVADLATFLESSSQVYHPAT